MDLSQVIAQRNSPRPPRKELPPKKEFDFTKEAVKVIRDALDRNNKDLLDGLNTLSQAIGAVATAPNSQAVVQLYAQLNDNLKRVASKIEKVADNPPKVVDTTSQINHMIGQLDLIARKNTDVFFDPDNSLKSAIAELKHQQELTNKLLARSDQRTKDLRDIRDSLKDTVDEAKREIKVESPDLSGLEKIMQDFTQKALDRPAFDFRVHRDSMGLITNIEAVPMGQKIKEV